MLQHRKKLQFSGKNPSQDLDTPSIRTTTAKSAVGMISFGMDVSFTFRGEP